MWTFNQRVVLVVANQSPPLPEVDAYFTAVKSGKWPRYIDKIYIDAPMDPDVGLMPVSAVVDLGGFEVDDFYEVIDVASIFTDAFQELYGSKVNYRISYQPW